MEKHFAKTKHLFGSGKASVRRDSQFSTHCQGDAHTGLGQRQGSQTVTSFFSFPCGGICVSMIARVQKNRTQHCRGAVGTSTRAVACALTSKPQPLLITPPVLSSARTRITKIAPSAVSAALRRSGKQRHTSAVTTPTCEGRIPSSKRINAHRGKKHKTTRRRDPLRRQTVSVKRNKAPMSKS